MAACVVVLLAPGCKQKPEAKPISLARFGGKVTFRLNLQKNDKFVYLHRAESKHYTETATTQVEVVNVEGRDYRTLTTITEAEVDGTGMTSGRRKRMAKRLKGTRIEGVFDQYSATKKLNAVTSDEALRQEIAIEQALAPGLMGVVFPKGGVAIGSQWHVNLDIGALSEMLGGGMEFDESGSGAPLTYTLKGAEDDGTRAMAVIDYRIDSHFRLNNMLTMIIGALGGTGDSAAMFTISGKGTMRVDIKSGLVIRDESETTMTMEFGKDKESITARNTIELQEFSRPGVLGKSR